jgi:predicted acyltransferase
MPRPGFPTDDTTMDAPPDPKPSGRLLSIDALRGFDMFWIIGGDALGRALAKWSDSGAGRAAAKQLDHVTWEGFRFYDLIFPLFLFLVGAVLPFSLGKLEGEGRGASYRRLARRTVLLFALGLVCNGVLQLRWPIRTLGVLQRIAICYGIAAVLALNLSSRGLVVATAAILLGYWGLLETVAAPGRSPGDFSIEGNLSGWIDRTYLPGKILKPYYGFGDNEGLLSTIPAVATALLGVLAGRWLRTDRGPWAKVGGLAAAGALALVVGEAWGLRFPIIKNIWTSSFVLVAGGLSLLLLALFYAVIDVLGFRRWAFFFVVIGANAITIYVVPRFVDFKKIADFFLGGVYRLAGEHVSPDFRAVVAAAGFLAAEWLFLLYLYRKRIFLRV